MTPSRSLRTGVVAVLAAATLATGSLAASAAEPEADGPYQGTYSATASADGLRVTMTLPAAPLSNTVADVGGPTAQAVLDSNGASQAFASFPYPGANLAVAGGLIKGASNGQIPAPDYPFYVVAYNPAVPEQTVGSGPYTIKAQSDATSSEGTATAGVKTPGVGTVGLAEANAATKSTTSSVLGSASSRITGLAIGPLEIGELVSVASANLDSTGTVERKAETRLVAAKVGLTNVVLDANGLSAGGTAGPAADTKSVQEALAGAGITVQLFPKEETDTGVVAPIVRITQKNEQSGAVLTYTIGGAAAFVQGSPSGDTSSSLDEALGGDTPAQSSPADESGSLSTTPGSDDAAPLGADTAAAYAAPDLAAGSSDGSTSIPPDGAMLSIPDASSAGSAALGGESAAAALPGGTAGGSGSLTTPGSAAPSSSVSLALANGYLVTRSQAAPTLIALTALIALALSAALGVHLLGKEARS